MNAEMGVLLRSIPSGCSMEKGKGYNDMISCTIVVSVSAVVMTTYPMINDSTINKSQVRISCGKFTRELDKEPLLN